VVFCLDLDGFKPVNDSFGHSAGDAVLAGVAERLQACVRKTDIVARLGGDEFLMVMFGMTASNGQMFADELIRRVSQPPYQIDDGLAASIGTSVGYACGPADGSGIEELQRKADAALYAAKAAGKGVHRRFASYHAARGPGSDLRRLAG
jgi:diguanylate cyclase (GGDEF)-like protein